MSPAPHDVERAVREDLAACHRLVAWLGWTDLVHTHISARSALAPDTLWLSPYGLLFDEVRPEHLVRVRPDGTVLDDPLGVGVHPAAPAIHGPLLRRRPDLGCVLHTHTVAGAAVAAQRGGLRPISQHALRFHRRLATHQLHGIALDQAVGEALTDDLGGHRAMLLRHHGLLTVGATVSEAFERMYFLQRACEVQVAAGPDVDEVPDEVAERVATQLERPERDAEARTWQALRRMLAAADGGSR